MIRIGCGLLFTLMSASPVYCLVPHLETGAFLHIRMHIRMIYVMNRDESISFVHCNND
jgi:hypothetical protein